MRILSVNPKTGVELVRDVHSHDHTPCDGCGRDQNTNGDPRTMYRYGEWQNADLGDVSRIAWHDGVFCSKRCHDAHIADAT